MSLSSIPASSSNVQETDSNDVLRIVSYVHCTNASTADLKKTRGLVLPKNTDDPRPLFPSVGYTSEFTTDNLSGQLVHALFEQQCLCYKAEEGSLLRMFHYNDRWYCATNRKLDAFDSKWNSDQSLGDYFKAALEQVGTSYDQLLQVLEPEHVYFFFVKTTVTNRFICKPNRGPPVYYVGIADIHGDTIRRVQQYDERLKVPVQEPVDDITPDRVATFVEGLDPLDCQGVIFVHPTTGDSVKVLHPTYTQYRHVRGNVSSLKSRYLSLMPDPDRQARLLELYPEQVDAFAECEKAFEKLVNFIFAAYIRRFIRKEYVVVDAVSYRIIREAHGKHIANRAFKVTRQVIHDILIDNAFLSVLIDLIKTVEQNPGMYANYAPDTFEAFFAAPRLEPATPQ